jgi:hypothetical protein
MQKTICQKMSVCFAFRARELDGLQGETRWLHDRDDSIGVRAQVFSRITAGL